MKNIKEVKLCFENVTSVTIQADDICMLKIDKISKSLSMYRNHTHKKHNCDVQYNCDSFSIILSESANKNGIYNGYGNIMSVFDRLKQYPDIVSVILVYEDDTTEEIYMKWSGNECNSLQHIEMMKDKMNIFIC